MSEPLGESSASAMSVCDRRVALRFWRRASPRSTHPKVASVADGATLDPRVLSRWLLLEPPREIDETLYAEVGCTLSERSENASKIAREPARPQTCIEAAVALRSMLERAVVRAIGGARRVAVLTGGGVDSGGLLGLTVRLMRERGGAAFAVALDYHADGDDRPHLEALQRHLGCEVLRVTPEDAARRADLVHGIDAVPFASPTGPMEVEMLARARAHGAEMVLSGENGDALFDGIPHALADLTRTGRWYEAVRSASVLRGFDAPNGERIFGWAIRPAIARVAPPSLRRWRARRSRPPVPAWAGPLTRASIEESWARKLAELDVRFATGASEDPWPTEQGRVWIAWYRHQQEHASGIERSDPYLDRELVDWVHALPPVWLLEGNVRRGLFREAIRGFVPESLRMREDKASFEPAMFRFVETIGGFESLRGYARVPRLADLGLVEPKPFEKAFDELARAPIGSWQWSNVWPALSAEAFLARGRNHAG